MKKIFFILSFICSANCFSQQLQCTGFLDLNFNSSLIEAVEYFAKNDTLKIEKISEKDRSGQKIFLQGKFAGHEVKEVQLVYFTDKLCMVGVVFGNQPNTFYEKLHDVYVEKYGKSLWFIKDYYLWKFLNNNEIRIKNDSEDGVVIYYTSSTFFEYQKAHIKIFDDAEKNKIDIDKSKI